MPLLKMTTKPVNPRRTNLAVLADPNDYTDYTMGELGFCYNPPRMRSSLQYGEEFYDNAYYELSQLLVTRLYRHYEDTTLGNKVYRLDQRVEWSEEARVLVADSVRLVREIRRIKKMDTELIDQIISDFGLEPEQFALPLRQHQLQALALYILLGYANNWGQMRTGKTPPSILYAYSLFIRREIDTVLIICPNSIKSIWLNELGKFLSPLVQKLSVIIQGSKSYKEGLWKASHIAKIANYECVRADIEIILDAYAGRRYAVILDESHNAKNPSKQTRAIQSLVFGDNPPVSFLALSGTPVANKPQDVQRVVAMTSPCLLGRDFDDFKKKYCYVGGYSGADITGYRKGSLETIHNFMARCSVRALRSDVDMDLGKVIQPQTVEMASIQAKVHKEIQTTLRTQLYEENGNWTSIRVNSFLSKAMKLQQVTAGFIFDNDSTPIWLGDKNNPKLKWLDSFIAEYLDDIGKLVIACKFRPMIQKLTQRYSKHGSTCIYGDVKTEERAARMSLFQTSEDCKVMVLNIRTSEGLDLNPCQFMVFITQDFYPLPNWQTEDRITGFNQAGESTIIPLVCESSVDVNVQKVLKQKQVWFDKVMEGKSQAKVTDEGLNITKDDLFEIVG